MATHFYCATDGDLRTQSDFFSMKSLLGSRVGSALIQPHDLHQQSEGVPPATVKGGMPTLGRSVRHS
jgi:hypothetical protein